MVDGTVNEAMSSPSHSVEQFDATRFCLKRRRNAIGLNGETQGTNRDEGSYNRPATLEVDTEMKLDGNSSTVSSIGLLSYFAFLQKDVNAKDEIDINFIISLIDNGADINAADKYGQTGAHVIARDWHPDVAACLMGFGMDFTAADFDDRTPMHVAAAVDYGAMIDMLNELKVPIDVATKRTCQTPLHFAACYDSINAMKSLIQHGADIDCRDATNRAPLFIAAEAGRMRAAELLLQIGAPASNFDTHGRSAVSLMVDKIPQLVPTALNQFCVIDPISRKSNLYVNQLEARPNSIGMREAMSVLEVVVQYDDLHIIVHPTLSYLTDIKWKKYARNKLLFNLIVYLFYAILVTAVATTQPRDDNIYPDDDVQYYFKLFGEVLILLMLVYFAVQESVENRKKRIMKTFYRTWSLRRLRMELKNCHPRWKEAKANCLSEIDRIQQPSEGHFDVWIIYDCCYALFFAIFIGIQLFLVFEWNKQVRKFHRYILCLLLLLTWMRILKLCRGLPYLGTLVSLLSHVWDGLWKLALLFIVLYVPYTCSMWVLFGGSVNADRMTKMGLNGAQFENPEDVIYYSWMMIFITELPISTLIKYDRIPAYILIGTYLAFVGIVCINLNIAVLTEAFSRFSELSKATALMHQASIAVRAEFSSRKRNENQTKTQQKVFDEKPNVCDWSHKMSKYTNTNTMAFLRDVSNMLQNVPQNGSNKSDTNTSSGLIDVLERNLRNLLEGCEKMTVKADMALRESRVRHNLLSEQLEQLKASQHIDRSPRHMLRSRAGSFSA